MSRKKRKQNRRQEAVGQNRREYPVPNREYKSSVFIMLFSEKKELLELYNAVSGKHYEDPEHSLELKAVMLNINAGHNPKLMEASRTLSDYAQYTDLVRTYVRTMSIEDAVERAVTECIRAGILREFLLKNRAEAKRMSIYEYDQAKHIRQEREDAWEEGRVKGREEGRAEGRKEGREEGRAEGRKEGREEGRAEGRKEGREEGRVQVFVSMIRRGFPAEDAISIAGITREQAEAALADGCGESAGTEKGKY